MAKAIAIKANKRPRAGTGAARAVRREGKVPAIVYGDNREAEPIALDANELTRLLVRGRFLSTVFELDVDGSKARVIPREVQRDPIKDRPIHVDFQRVAEGGRIRVNVPVKFINEGLSPGLKRGGVLNVVRHEIEVVCPADAIPDHFEVNLEGLEIGRSVHISSIKLPEGVKPTIRGRDFTVASIGGHRIEEEVAPTEAAVAEGEVPAEAAAEPGAAPPGEAKAGAGKEAGTAKAPAGKEAAPAAKPAAEKGKK
jgi:large subunit ribosomal protein L25